MSFVEFPFLVVVVFVIETDNFRYSLLTLGEVASIAGSATSACADGVGTSASFGRPYGLALDSNFILYVADANCNMIRKVTTSGIIAHSDKSCFFCKASEHRVPVNNKDIALLLFSK